MTHKRLWGFMLLTTLLCGALKLGAQTETRSNAIPQFTSEEEKAKWIKENPDAYQKAGGDVLAAPSQDTPPEFKTAEEKAAWLAAHPQTPTEAVKETAAPREKTAQATEQPQAGNLGDDQAAQAPTVPSAKPEDPTFPVYINTGNPERDAVSYELRKQEWYENHPAPIHVSKAEFEALTPEKQQAMLKDPNYIVEQ